MRASAEPLSVVAIDPEAQALQRAALLTGLTGLGLIVGVIGGLVAWPAWSVMLAWLLAYLAGGVPSARTALHGLGEGRLDIDLLMVVAALAAAAVGEPRDGAILLFLFSLANTLEDYAMGRTRRAVEALMELRPDVAHRRIKATGGGGDGTETVPVASLALGDVVVVRPGERLPVDGRVIEGTSAVDQAAITGESIPVDKAPGDEVFAATVNRNGVLAVEVTRMPEESTVARMVELVTQARVGRSPSERFSDWFGQRYTILVLAGSTLALGVFFLLGWSFEDALYRTATLLVAASPCAIVISVPAAVLSGLAAAARVGVLFKGGAAIERFGAIDILAVDKTGTLTQGRPEVAEIRAFEGDEDALLARAAALEAHSEHPLARSVRELARRRGLEVPAADDVQATPGYGIEGSIGGRRLWVGSKRMVERAGAVAHGEAADVLAALEEAGETLVLVGEGTRLIGAIGIADPLRKSAAGALQALRRRGVGRIVMLTGDHPGAARRVARALDIPDADIAAELLPEGKVEVVRELRRAGTVAFVGDGVNDAPALASADVGVAMGVGGSDVAIESADVALISDDLGALVRGHDLALRTNRIIRQNLAFATGAMVVLVLLTLFAALPLPLAVVGHEGGTVLVVFNGLRLLLGRGAA